MGNHVSLDFSIFNLKDPLVCYFLCHVDGCQESFLCVCLSLIFAHKLFKLLPYIPAFLFFFFFQQHLLTCWLPLNYVCDTVSLFQIMARSTTALFILKSILAVLCLFIMKLQYFCLFGEHIELKYGRCMCMHACIVLTCTGVVFLITKYVRQ